jgi:hypothetical protein
MADGLLHIQDVSIVSCKIVGVSGHPTDVSAMVVEINYFEDIFSNFVSGALVINDSVGLIQMFQFQGQEVLILEIDKPGLDDPLKKTLRIYKHSGRSQTKTSNENYIIHFCSEEAYLNEQYKISKSYKNMIIADIVHGILENDLKINPDLLINFDKTSGVHDILVPNLKPFQAINWLTTFAQADQDKNAGAFFLFYEDKYGFSFRSVLNLYKQKTARKYKYEEKNLKSTQNDLISDVNKEFVNVIAFEHISAFDSISAVKQGTMASKTITIDPLRLKFGENAHDYNEYTKNVQSLDYASLPNSAENRMGDTMNKTVGAVKFVISTSGQSENKYIKDKEVPVNEFSPEKTTSVRSSQLSLMWSNRIKIIIPGDIGLTVGMIVDFDKPEISYNNPQSKEKTSDPIYSGKYLITALRHIITQENRFTTILELCKDSYPNKTFKYDNTNPGWKEVR